MNIVFSKEELSEIFMRPVGSDVSGICINSKDVTNGDLFVALKGEKVDAHNFIKQVVSDGAIAAVVEKGIIGVDNSKLIRVGSSYEALVKLAKYNVAKTHAKYIGVTGSVGKTTTKNLINHILTYVESPKEIYVTQKNFNSQIGLPFCAATMPRNTKFGIFEMGMSSFGDIKKLINIVPPSVSIITEVCEPHLQFFNSIWDIARAKSEIFETQDPQEAAVIPSDSPYTDFLRKMAMECGIKKIFSFGSQKSDAQVVSSHFYENYIDITANIFGEKVNYKINGSNNACASDSLAAILAAYVVLGASPQKLADTVSSFSPSTMRGENIFIEKHDIILIDDSYNACPSSMRSAIQSLSRHNNRRKILVIGDMLELGNNSVYYHENLSATIDKFDIDLVFACGDLSKHLFDNLQPKKQGVWCKNSQELTEKVLKEIKNGDCILVKGSRSMKTDVVVDAIKDMD